jgi:hypothetical protein
MKKLLFIVFALALSSKAMAQTYTPVALSGFNQDVVANGTSVSALSTSTYDLDGSNGAGYTFMAQGYTNPSGTATTAFLPASGLINSAATSGVSYLLASYSGNNSLRLPVTGNAAAATGTLTFTSSVAAEEVYVLATSGGGPSTVTMTVNFTDGSNQVFTNQTVADWFNGTGFAIQGLGRVGRNATSTIENPTNNPRLYQVKLTLSAANYSKPIQSVDFNKTSTTTGALNVMGITVKSTCVPNAGTAFANLTSACSSTSIALSLPGATSGTGVSYQWQASTNGGNTWNDINGATSSTYTALGQTSTAMYRAVITCISSGAQAISGAKTVTQNPFYDCYCSPTSSGNNEYIKTVSVNTLSNNSNANNAGYGNFTTNAALTTTLNAGGTYVFTLLVRANNNGSQGGVWIDYNQNSTFEATEYTALGGSNLTATDATLYSALTIPSTALTGKTRMRVRWKNGAITGSAADACATGWSGEAEDYYITIGSQSDCSGTPGAGTVSAATATSSSITTVCSGTAFTFYTKNYDGESGYTYQWQRSLAGANNYSNLGSSQTSPVYTVSTQSDSYDYRVITTCTNSGNSTTSSPVSITTNFLNCYCTNTSTGTNEYIRAVSITNTSLSNTTNANNNGGFSLFTGAANYTATLNREITYVFNVEVRANNAAGSSAAIWIDFDHNGTFDASEYVYVGSTTQTSGSTVMFTKSWQIPASALLGQTRMRVRYRNNLTIAATDACTTGWSGENEDYIITIDPSLACAGAPAATTAQSTVSTVCENTTFTLSASGIPAGTTGLTYQWQRRDAGSTGSFTNLGSAQPGDAYIGNQSVATEYRVIVTCTATGDVTTSSSVTVNKTNFQACFCVPTGGSSAGEYIKSVNVNGASGFTAATSNATAYNDYTGNSSYTTTLSQGFSYPFTFIIHANTSGSQGGIWVDYNQNGTFDASEYQAMGSSSAFNTDVTFNVTLAIPSTALAGATRMRVRWHNASVASTDGCSGGWNGETEDYLITISAPVACSGTPPTPTATSTVTNTCSGTSFTLGATGIATGVTDFSYQWQSRTGTNAFANLGTTQTTAAYTITSQSVATDYRLILTCLNSGISATSNVISVSQNSFLNCYCTPTYTSGGTNDFIGSVKIGTMTNTSTGNASPYYRNYTSQQPGTIAIPDLVTGQTSNIVLTFGSDGSQYSAVWIDFNHNGTFDTNEYFSQGTNAGASGTSTIAVAIPSSALTGQTRLRVRGGHDTATNSGLACSSVSFGEAEDYLINLIAPVPCAGNPPAITVSSTATAICSGTSITLSATGIASNVTGMSYQWQSKVGSAAYTNLGSAQTTANYIVSAQTATTTYRLIVTCTASNRSTTSNAVTVTQNAYANCYCTPTGGSCTNEWIRGVRLNTLNNSSTTCTTGGYANYPSNGALTTTLGLGNTYTINLDLRINATNSQAAVWIDFDHSGTFDASEYKLIGTGPSTGFAALNTTFTNTITIPSTALTGTTRMRVRSNNGSLSNSQACLNSYFGEVEDYLVTITQANLVISTTATIPAGSYNDITVTNTGVATLGGPVSASGSVIVQNGGSFADNCQLLNGTGTFTLESGATLYICNTAGIATSGTTGAIRVTGFRNFSKDASYVYNGSATQITGTGIPASVLNLTINNAAGVSLSKASGVQRMLTLQNGNLNLAGQSFTLLSNANGTAMVVNNNGTVNGTVTVQRYVTRTAYTGGNSYHHYSSPVTSTTLSDLGDRGFVPFVNPAYNVLPADSTMPYNQFPNIFRYNQNRLTSTFNDFNTGWESPASTSEVMTPGKGYTVRVSPKTLDLKGTLNTGTLSAISLGHSGQTESGWHLLGNPYPSPIDWDQVKASKPAAMMDAVYTFRPDGAFTGSYASYVNGVSTNGLTGGVIPAMQGFFVRVTAATAFSFTNAMRVTTYTDPSFYRSAETRPLVQLNLVNEKGAADELAIYQQEGATVNDDAAFDAYKVQANGPEVPTLYAITPNNQHLSINGLPVISEETVIPLGLSVAEGGTYSFNTEKLLNIPASMDVLLEDRTQGTLHNLRTSGNYSFNLTSGSNATRFALRFKPAAKGGDALASLKDAMVYPNPTSSRKRIYPEPGRTQD